MRTNLERALNGRDLAELAVKEPGLPRLGVEDYEMGLVDVLANLMHFARRYDIDFEDALDSAAMHHDAEKRFNWEEVPDA